MMLRLLLICELRLILFLWYNKEIQGTYCHKAVVPDLLESEGGGGYLCLVQDQAVEHSESFSS